jgi:hypothetical protein
VASGKTNDKTKIDASADFRPGSVNPFDPTMKLLKQSSLDRT